jgi:cation transporter-like permease
VFENLKFKIKNYSLLGLGLAFGLLTHPVFAQNSDSNTLLYPPSVIPQTDTNIGGSNGACIGLAGRIEMGNIHLAQLPCFIKYFTQTLIGVAGTASVIMVMYGGFMYIIKGDEDKAKFKSTIVHALVGLAVSLMAWIIVDLAVRFATE